METDLAIPVPLRMLSLHQPYALMVVTGCKKVETRSWQTAYRGWLAIHATKTVPQEMRSAYHVAVSSGMFPANVPFGAIVCLVHLVRIVPTREAKFLVSALERSWGNYDTGRFAWFFDDRRILQPIKCKGGQSIRLVPDEVRAQIVSQLEAARV